MEDFRSKSYGDGRMKMERYSYDGHRPDPTGIQDLRWRCYSTSYASSSHAEAPRNLQVEAAKDAKIKKGKSGNGSTSKSWSLGDPELQRKKRVASYKAYTVEGKVKGSVRKSFRWVKDRCIMMVHGWK